MAILGIRADPMFIYDPPDLDYLTFLEGVVEDVYRTKDRQHREAKAEADAAASGARR